jgi:hypothetical protein
MTLRASIAGEQYATQDVRTSSARLQECIHSGGGWKANITNRQIVDFKAIFSDPQMKNVCLQYVECDNAEKKEHFAQVLECGQTTSGGCEDLATCLAQRAASPRPFYLADISAKSGANHYAASGNIQCQQVGGPEALYGNDARAVCLQKMDCTKDASKQRYVVACPVTGMVTTPRPEDGPVQECLPFVECAQKQYRLTAFQTYAEPAPKTVASPSQPATKAKAKATKASVKTTKAVATKKPAKSTRLPASQPKKKTKKKPPLTLRSGAALKRKAYIVMLQAFAKSSFREITVMIESVTAIVSTV